MSYRVHTADITNLVVGTDHYDDDEGTGTVLVISDHGNQEQWLVKGMTAGQRECVVQLFDIITMLQLHKATDASDHERCDVCGDTIRPDDHCCPNDDCPSHEIQP